MSGRSLFRRCRRALTIPALLAASFAASLAATSVARANDSPLSTPGDYSLAPPALVQGGVASTSFGSGGLRSSAVRLDSGLIGGNTRAFVALGAGQGPQFHGRPSISGSSVAAGVATELPFGSTLSISAGVERDRFSGRGFPISGAGALP